MSTTYNILILGASYGSLLAAKLLLAGHHVQLVCRAAGADLINTEGTRVRLPIPGREGLLEIDSRKCAGKLSATTPDKVNLRDFDLIGLAMQESQYSSPDVRALLADIAKMRVPCISIMNMPPPPYVARLPGVDVSKIRDAYTDATVWDGFDPAAMTLCSPDPQAFRPPEEKSNVLQVRLPTNFKAAPFESEEATQMLRNIEADIEAIRFDTGSGMIELPVKLKVHESIFVPLAKWSMLMTGNYRCIQKDGMRPIKDAVLDDVELSKSVYNWVGDLCRTMGAAESDLVPFMKYAAAANNLANPSSAARALFGGAPNIERVDKLVQGIAAQRGQKHAAIDEIVELVDARLAANRAAAETKAALLAFPTRPQSESAASSQNCSVR